MDASNVTGILAWVHGYSLRTKRDDIFVYDQDDELVTQEHVDALHEFLVRARILRFGRGQFRGDGDEVIYLFDEMDENFGYAINLVDPVCSEWGYAPTGIYVEEAV